MSDVVVVFGPISQSTSPHPCQKQFSKQRASRRLLKYAQSSAHHKWPRGGSSFISPLLAIFLHEPRMPQVAIIYIYMLLRPQQHQRNISSTHCDGHGNGLARVARCTKMYLYMPAQAQRVCVCDHVCIYRHGKFIGLYYMRYFE